MAVTRVLYVGQNAKIGGVEYPIQSASCETTLPQEDVFAFGVLGSAGRFQKEPSTVKADLKLFLSLGTGAGADVGHFGADVISDLTGKAFAGTLTPITVSPNGFTMSGILTSLSVDATNGQFVTIDASFEGIGDPYFAPAPETNVTTAAGTALTIPLQPVTSDYVQVAGACVNSAKFSLEIPTERLSCLGGVLTGAQELLTGDHLFVGKPPLKATMVVEGTSATAVDTVDFGGLRVKINDGKTISKSFNQAVGEAGANYSFTVESLDASFNTVAPAQG